jgi:hypothetical protein
MAQSVQHRVNVNLGECLRDEEMVSGGDFGVEREGGEQIFAAA